ncbi:coiled-coil domain-containing protein 89-like isoform X2 [Xenia sp. Carnegie-2017]|uniref:coiled-coil domain-containing protein 89-like isoform X2 n=1 Tax=Xenia sp. Carnegie-2017 TaxID=2897299 RepID=UPI001F04420A|nr:coiled-coil domain-containing protein 89-like isoform X2 [Xenia sp. Carnegie-2017]
MASRNATRSPKDLRQILTIAHEESAFSSDEVEKNLAKLKGLPKDEISETAMLRDRIDQQSELICILKNRADSNLIKSQCFENEIKELHRAKDDAECKFLQEHKKFQILEERFKILYNNHEEIIKIKDGYKVVNDELRKENKNLLERKEEKIAAMASEKDKIITDLTKEMASLKEQLQKSNDLLEELRENFQKNESHLNEEVKRLKLIVEKSGETSLEMTEKSEALSSQLSANKIETSKLLEEKSHLSKEISEAKKTITEKDRKMNQLCMKVDELELMLKTQTEKYLNLLHIRNTQTSC